MYDDYIYYIAPKPLIPLTKKLSHRYFRMFPQNAAVVTGPSKKCQEYTYEIGSDKKVEVIPNPVELDAFAPQTSTPQQRAQIPRTVPHSAGCHCRLLCRQTGTGKKCGRAAALLGTGDETAGQYAPAHHRRRTGKGAAGAACTAAGHHRHGHLYRQGAASPTCLRTSTPATSMSPPPFRTPTPSRCWKGWQAVYRYCSCTTS